MYIIGTNIFFGISPLPKQKHQYQMFGIVLKEYRIINNFSHRLNNANDDFLKLSI